MSRIGCLLKDSELFILFPENSQILLKISVIPILLTFNHVSGSAKSVSKQPNQLIVELNSSLLQKFGTKVMTNKLLRLSFLFLRLWQYESII